MSGIRHFVAFAWSQVCGGGLSPRHYLLYRTEFMAWRLRRSNWKMLTRPSDGWVSINAWFLIINCPCAAFWWWKDNQISFRNRQRTMKGSTFRAYETAAPLPIGVASDIWNKTILPFYLSVFLGLAGREAESLSPTSSGYGLTIRWLYPQQKGKTYLLQKKLVLSMTLNCIWWWGSSSVALGSVEYLYIVMTSRSTQTNNSGACLSFICRSNRSKNYLYSIRLCATKTSSQLHENINTNERNSQTSWLIITLDGLICC